MVYKIYTNYSLPAKGPITFSSDGASVWKPNERSLLGLPGFAGLPPLRSGRPFLPRLKSPGFLGRIL